MRIRHAVSLASCRIASIFRLDRFHQGQPVSGQLSGFTDVAYDWRMPIRAETSDGRVGTGTLEETVVHRDTAAAFPIASVETFLTSTWLGVGSFIPARHSALRAARSRSGRVRTVMMTWFA